MKSRLWETTSDRYSSEGIRDIADSLVAYLGEHIVHDPPEVGWTDNNFSVLRTFFSGDLGLDFFHRPRLNFVDDDRGEFMWDFLATKPKGGIYLAAESEQFTHGAQNMQALSHDFEKLLYVFAPIRVMICKAKSGREAQTIAESLENYARGCCLEFNPGSVFILHCCLPGPGGGVSYLWQSKGSPAKPVLEDLTFGSPIGN